jgi:hypothetical protein
MRRFLASIAVVAVLGCGGDSNGPKQTLTGTWRGPVSTATVTLNLTQNGRDVTGNGTIVGGTESAALTVTGTSNLPTFSLTISASGFESMNFSGTLGTNQLAGTLNGSGFVNAAVTLTKQ